MEMKFALVALAVVYCFAAFPTIAGYCIYNNHTGDSSVWVRQIDGHGTDNYFARFARRSLVSGASACCPYTEHDCNASGGPDAVVKFSIKQWLPPYSDPFFVINCPAGGSIILNGDAETSAILVLDKDGNPFPFEIEYTVQNVMDFVKRSYVDDREPVE